MNQLSEHPLEAVQRIASVPSILEVCCRTTGLGYAAIARVTPTLWMACAVRDECNFGLRAGDQVDINITICSKVVSTRQFVAIDNILTDKNFCSHPSLKTYNFQSYIGVPILLPDGEPFGVLFALDPGPARVNNTYTIGMFRLFAELIGLQLNEQ